MIVIGYARTHWRWSTEWLRAYACGDDWLMETLEITAVHFAMGMIDLRSDLPS